MIRTQAASSLDNLTDLRQELADRTLVLNGVFDDEIKRLSAVRDEASEKLGMVETVKEAEDVRTAADAYSTMIRAAADKTAAAASSALAAANEKMSAALAKEKSVAKREADAAAMKDDYEHRAESFDASCAKREAALATREAALSAAQAKLAADSLALTARQQEVLRNLDAAKALATS